VISPERKPVSATPVVVLSGPSGSGKTTIVHRLLADSPVRLLMSISATTRPRRPGEVHGQDYYFLSPEEFARRRGAGEFLECAEVHRSGYWYGTLFSELDRAAQMGAWPLLEIDVEGALNVMRVFPDALSIFLTTPAEQYEQRLRARGTESEEVIQRRLQTARNELQLAGSYRYLVVNDDLDRAVREICSIIAQREAELHAG
jgi:guanylate kinase